MSLVAKICIVFFLVLCSTKTFSKDLYILIVGQSIPLNCHHHLFETSIGVSKIELLDDKIPESSQFLWADCHKDSTWILLREKIIDEYHAKSVTFIPFGLDLTSIDDLLSSGESFNKLSNLIKFSKQKSIKFDYALWDQGSAYGVPDHNKNLIKLNKILKLISINVSIEKWLISQPSTCGNLSHENIQKISNLATYNYIFRRFPGPKKDNLGSEFRHSNCHLNFRGQEKMADLWLQSMILADRVNNSIQNETLIKKFKGIFNNQN